MAKIPLDKYYTSNELAKYCVNKAKEIIGEENITEYIEPSAGNGVFLKYLDKPYKAYDITPEGEDIIKQDYLKLDLEYKKGRCIIGNPPFGDRNILSVKFYKQAIKQGDYITFILPISQLNNNMQMYEFDLIHSEDLGEKEYSGKSVHCCLNIYKRPKNGLLNKKPNYNLKDIKITEIRLNNKICKDYDIRICGWGKKIGKECDYPNQFAKEFCIKVLNNKYKDMVIKIIKNTKWDKIYNMTKSPNLLQWQIYKYLKEQIPELE